MFVFGQAPAGGSSPHMRGLRIKLRPIRDYAPDKDIEMLSKPMLGPADYHRYSLSQTIMQGGKSFHCIKILRLRVHSVR